MKTAAPSLLAAITATVALSAGVVLTAGDPAVFETRQASFAVFDDGSSYDAIRDTSRPDAMEPERVKVMAPAPIRETAGVRS